MLHLFFLLLLSQDVSLTITSDSNASLELDGKPVGAARPGVPLRVVAAAGDHVVAAIPEGGPAWRKEVTVSATEANELAVPLRRHLQKVEIVRAGYWRDDRTGLTWASSDNGSGATVSQARSYCGQLAQGGFHDWRLPEIDELRTIFGGEADDRGFRVIAPLKLTGWAWSATVGNEPAENWTLDFGDGARASVAAGDAGLNRALCVRGNRSAPAK